MTVGLLMLSLPVALRVFAFVRPYMAWPLAVLACACIAVAIVKRARVAALGEDLRRLEFQEDLARSSPSPAEERAEHLLNINDYALRQYYALTLSQSAWVFSVGVVCLVCGLAIAGGTLYLLKSGNTPSTTWSQEIAVALVGAVGTILTSYVAVTYLKMHATSAASLTSFHARLVGSQQLYLANLLASRLPVDSRSDVLARMAIILANSYAKPQAEHNNVPEA